MANEPKPEITIVEVEVSKETQDLVQKGMPDATNEVKEQTMALVEAIRTKAQSEAQKAGDFTREKYLEAVKSAQADIEKLNLFDPERIEKSINLMKNEVEKDWDSIVKQAQEIGERLSEAAKKAWEILTEPKSDDSSSNS